MSTLTASQIKAMKKIPEIMKMKKEFDKMNKTKGGGKKRKIKGSGDDFWGSVGSWFNQAGQDVDKFLKDSKVISTVAPIIETILPFTPLAYLAPAVGVASGVAGKLGYGESKGKGKTKTFNFNGTINNDQNLFKGGCDRCIEGNIKGGSDSGYETNGAINNAIFNGTSTRIMKIKF